MIRYEKEKVFNLYQRLVLIFQFSIFIENT